MNDAGGQMLLGIRLTMDASGVVTGASIADTSLAGIRVKAQQASVALQNMVSKKSTEALQAAAGAATAGFVALKAGAGVQRELDAMLDAAKTFELSLKGLQFVANMTNEQLEDAKKLARYYGRVTQFDPEEVVDGMTAMMAAGMEYEEMLKALPAAMDYVIGSRGTVSLEQGMDAVAVATKKFQLTGESAIEIMDAFAHATRNSNLRVREFNMFLRSTRDATLKLKMTPGEVFAIGGALRDVGLTAPMAGNSIAAFSRKVLMNMRIINRWMAKKKIASTAELFGLSDEELRKAPDKVKAFAMFGVDIFDQETHKMRRMIDILADLGRKATTLRGENEEKFLVGLQTLFSSQAAGVVEYVTRMRRAGEKGVDAFIAQYDRLSKKSTAANREMAASVEETQLGQEKFIEGTKKTIRGVWGEQVLPFVAGLTRVYRNIYDQILSWSEGNTALARALFVVFYAVSSVLKVVGVLLIAFGAIGVTLALIAPAISTIGPLFLSLTKVAVGALPLLLTGVLLVAKIGLGLYLAFKAWEYIWSDKATGLFLQLREIFTDIKLVFAAFKDWSDGAVNDMGLFEQIQKRGLTGWVFWLLQIRDKLVAIWTGVVGGFKAAITPMFKVLAGFSEIVGAIIWVFRKLVGLKEATDITETLKVWTEFGRVLGYLAAGIMTIIIAKYVALGIQMAVVVVKMAAQAAIWLVLHARMMMIIGLIALAIWGFKKLWTVGEGLGPAIYEGLESLMTQLTVMWEALTGWFGNLGSAVADAFTGNLEPILNWFERALEFIKAVFGFMLGETTYLEFASALPPAFKAATAPENVERIRASAGIGSYTPEKLLTIEERRKLIEERAKATSREGRPTRTIEIGKIEVTAGKMTPKEAERLARELVKKMVDLEDERAEEMYE
jgi:TP901 family phage tail tape measure protein